MKSKRRTVFASRCDDLVIERVPSGIQHRCGMCANERVSVGTNTDIAKSFANRNSTYTSGTLPLRESGMTWKAPAQVDQKILSWGSE